MKLPKATFISGILLVLVHLFYSFVQNAIFRHVGERLAVKIIFAVLAAAAVAALIWVIIKGQRDLLAVLFASGALFFILISRPIFATRLSLFLFFSFGTVTGLEERQVAKWLPLLLIVLFACSAEWLPTLFVSGLQFFWLDAWTMILGALAGRLLLCSSR